MKYYHSELTEITEVKNQTLDQIAGSKNSLV